MSDIILNETELVEAIRHQFHTMSDLKYKRSLLEFEDNDGAFLGDNVFETSFKMRDNLPPLIYEVSGPYDVISNEYATIGRVYEKGQRVFEADIKDQIQQRTAAMVWLFVSALNHTPNNVLFIGAGKLATETVRYLKCFIPDLNNIDYHARNQRADSFEKDCQGIQVQANYKPTLNMKSYDTIIMVTNTAKCVIDSSNIDEVHDGAIIASLCTTSQTGEISGEVYGRADVNVMFDYDLTRTFTPDMRAADKAGYLSNVTFLKDILDEGSPQNMQNKKNILRITGTPMQNIAVIDMLRSTDQS